MQLLIAQADAGEGLGRSQGGKHRQGKEEGVQALYRVYLVQLFSPILGTFHYWAEPVPYLEHFWVKPVKITPCTNFDKKHLKDGLQVQVSGAVHSPLIQPREHHGAQIWKEMMTSKHKRGHKSGKC